MSTKQRDLEELVAKGRMQTDAERHAKEVSKKRDAAKLAEINARAVQLKTYATWRSLSICTDLIVWLVVLTAVLLFLRVALVGLEFDILPWLEVASLSILLCLWRVVARRRRAFAMIADLPFTTRGYIEFLHHPSSLSYGESMPPEKVTVVIRFAAKSPPPEGVLENALLGAGGRAFKGMSPEGIKLEGGCYYDGHCRWLVNYMPTLCATLRTVHQVYPISSIELKRD